MSEEALLEPATSTVKPAPAKHPQPKQRISLRKTILAWASFDFANSSFAVIMVTFVYPIYFGSLAPKGEGDAYWGIAVSASMLLVALITPILGAMADRSRSKKGYLFAFTAVCIACTVGLYFVGPGMVGAAMALFILANAGFEGGIVFYDAFLPEITEEATYGRVSGFGFATGYLGSLAILIAAVPLLNAKLYPETFLLTAAFFLVFALPIFLFVPEHKKRAPAKQIGNPVLYGIRKTLNTIRHIRQYRNVSIFLLAFFLYNDAILTVIAFASRFAHDSLNFSVAELTYFFMMIQIIAVVGSILFGRITDKLGAKITIISTLLIWIVVVIGAFFANDATTFYIVGAVAGMGLGSSQSASRGMMAKLTPPEHTAEFFGFYDGFCGKASAVIGPLVYGFLSKSFGQRPAIVSLGIFFILGLIMMRSVREQRDELVPPALG